MQSEVGGPFERMFGCRPAEMTGGAGRSAFKDPVQICAVATGGRAASGAVGLGIASVRGAGHGRPLRGMVGILAAYVASCAGGAAFKEPVQICDVATGGRAADGAVGLGIASVQGIGLGPPLGVMVRIPATDVAGGAGCLGNASLVIQTMTFGAGLHMGAGFRLMARKQPADRMPRSGIKIGLGTGASASRHNQDENGQQQGKWQRGPVYLWHVLHLSLFCLPWHFAQEAGLILPSMRWRLR